MKKNSKVWIFPLLLSLVLIISISCKKDTIPIETSIVTDIDGNIYKTLKIGNQWWMAENLKTTKFHDGTPIPNVTDNDNWNRLYSSAYCWYQNDVANKNTKGGALYNGYAAMDSRNIAPTGWHVPTIDEWTTFKNYLGRESISMSDLEKEGFSTIVVGFRSGLFDFNGLALSWLSSTEKSMDYASVGFIFIQEFVLNDSSFTTGNYSNKYDGYSIRCVKD